MFPSFLKIQLYFVNKTIKQQDSVVFMSDLLSQLIFCSAAGKKARSLNRFDLGYLFYVISLKVIKFKNVS